MHNYDSLDCSGVCKHGRQKIGCGACYQSVVEEVREAEKKEAEKLRPRKTVTRINLTEHKLQVILYTDENNSFSLRYWSDTWTHPDDYKPDHCYLDREEAQVVYIEDQRKLVTIHTCRQHMVVVDWTAL